MRRSFLTLLLALALPITAAQAASGIIAGAIRWDAWYDVNPGSSEISAQQSLGPAAYQSRAPSHCTVVSGFAISCIGTQAVMDAEITAAAGGGLKYWAFDAYTTGSGLTNAWNLYQSSSLKANINWCWLSGLSLMGSTGNYTTQMALLATQLEQSNYQKVTIGGVANRPVLYILWAAADFANNYGSSYANVAAALTYLRGQVTAAGLGTPYIVVLTGSPATAAAIQAGIGADAIGSYNTPATAAIAGTYASLDTQTQAFWPALAATGVPIVPIAMTGFDSRPRIAHPLTFTVPTQKPYIGFGQYYAVSTNAQLVAELTAAVSYINGNPVSVPSKLLLIYSWNECDEGGGALIPTLGDPTGSRLAAISSVIQ